MNLELGFLQFECFLHIVQWNRRLALLPEPVFLHIFGSGLFYLFVISVKKEWFYLALHKPLCWVLIERVFG
jgi:hypothetical protein